MKLSERLRRERETDHLAMEAADLLDIMETRLRFVQGAIVGIETILELMRHTLELSRDISNPDSPAAKSSKSDIPQ